MFYAFILLFFFPSFVANPAESGEIRGRVSDFTTGELLAGVNVVIQGTTQGAATDGDGNYRISPVEPGVYVLEIRFLGYDSKFVTDVVVGSKRITYVNVQLSEAVIEGEEVTVSGGYFDKAITGTGTVSFNPEELRRSPGAGQELSRVLMALPSVASRGETSQDMMVRGGSPIENGFIIDNIPVPGVQHFRTAGGVSNGPIGIVNTDLVSNIDFYNGGFSSRYGDRLSSFSEITYREGTRNGFRGDGVMNMAGFGLNMEAGMLDGKGSWVISGRRSFLDLIADAINAGGAPSYSDAQAKVTLDLNPRNKLTVLNIYGTSNYTQEVDNAREIGDSEYFRSTFDQNTIGLNLRTLWGSGFTNTSVSHSYNTIDFDRNLVDTFEKVQALNQRVDEFRLRSVSTFQLTSRLEMETGADFSVERGDFDYFFKAEQSRTGENLPDYVRKDNLNGILGGGFVSASYRPVVPLKLTAGLRADYSGYAELVDISPRLAANFAINQKTSVFASWGRFHQNLPRYLLSQGDDIRALKTVRSEHFIGGADYLLTADTKLTVEVFNKTYSRAPVLPEVNPLNDPAWILDNASGFYETLESTGEAWARGVELLVQKKLAKDLYGSVSASYFRTRFKDYNGTWRDRDFDNKTMFSVIGGYRPSQKWEFSVRWTYLGNRPTTPLDLTASAAADNERINPSLFNTAELPAFHSMYLRSDRRFNFKKTNLVLYLELWNAYNRKNVDSYYWNRDLNQVDEFYQFTILPVVGLKFEF